MEQRDLVIVNRLGLHARAAAQLVQLANNFKAEIQLIKDGTAVNAKSIMGLLMLAAPKGSQITLTAQGSDADEAMQQLEELINNGFGED